MPEIAAFIQVRLGSERLPGKSLLEVQPGVPLIDRVVSRVLGSRFCSHGNVYLLTTESPADDPLVEHFDRRGLRWFRGSEENVSARFYQACRDVRPEYFFRICGDNPFIEPRFMDALVDRIAGGGFDYLSYRTPEGVPAIRSHYGFYVELVSSASLQAADLSGLDAANREHVTPRFYTGDRFNAELLPMPRELVDDHVRLTVDTPADLEVVKEILGNIPVEFQIEDVYAFLAQRSDLKKKMAKQIRENAK